MSAHPYSYKIEESRFIMQIECDEPIFYNNPLCYELMQHSMHVDDIDPMSSIEVTTVDNITYECKLVAKDGREFRQTLVFAYPEDTVPGMAFDVTDLWEENELFHYGDIRKIIIELIIQFKLRELNLTWN